MKPSYTATHIYFVLEELCARAGLTVEYVDLPKSIYARSKDERIQMPTDGRFTDSDHAAAVLGHELAHLFVNPQFPALQDGRPLRMEQGMLLESECDRLGAYLYMLAQRIAGREDRLALEAMKPPAD